MLVSASAGTDLRVDVTVGNRPRPDFLALETHGVHLLDWTALGPGPHHRSARLSLRHVARALPDARTAAVAFSDGEHLGIPLGAAMASLRIRTPHMMIGHRLLDPRKSRVLRALPFTRGVHRIVVHSRRQADLLPAAIGVGADTIRLVPYGVDTAFWKPGEREVEPDLVFAAGREHRDYRTLAFACGTQPVRVVITNQSTHSPRASGQAVSDWPSNMSQRSLTFLQLRDMYQRAAIIVVPLLDTDFPAGITGTLEAMAMGKAVVASATADMHEIVEDGKTGLLVPPGDVGALRCAMSRLLRDPDECKALGAEARRRVIEHNSLETYAGHLATEMNELSELNPNNRR